MTFTNVFGNDTLPPSEYGYAAFSLTSNSTFVWPYNSSNAAFTIAKVMDVACSAGVVMTLPDARQVSTGEDFLIRNLGAETLTIHDADGVQVTQVLAGSATYLYLTDNSTEAGTFGVIAFGVGTSSVDAATLVGYGIKAIGASLNQSHPTFPVNSAVTIADDHRAKLVIFTGGAETFPLTSASTLGDDYFVMFRNEGTGTATLDPASAETIDGQATMQVQPGESLILICTGSEWFTVGYGRSVLYQFTQLTKDVSAGGTITLTAAEASNKLLTFIGNPSGAVEVVVPAVVAVYYTQSSISTAQTITLKTAAGSGVGIAQGARIIAICDGTNVVSAQSAVANTSVSLTDGSAAVPSLYFATKTNSGLFKSGTQDVGITVDGVAVGIFGSTGIQTTTIGANSSQRHTVPAVSSDTIALLAATQTLTNKTISGSSNTLTNIGNASLTNSSVTINGSTVSLGGSITVTATASQALTIGTGLTGTSYNGSAPVTIAIDSSVVTLTGTQTLTNKTLTSPTINGGSINNTPIGQSTPAAGSFTTLGVGITSPAFKAHIYDTEDTGLQVTKAGAAASRFKVVSGKAVLGYDGANGDTEILSWNAAGLSVTGALSTSGELQTSTGQKITAALPYVWLIESDQAVDQKGWITRVNGSNYQIVAVNDAGGGLATVADVTRAGLWSLPSLSVSGNTTLGDAATDTVTVNGYMGVGGATNSGQGIRVSNSSLAGSDQSGIGLFPVASSGATSRLMGAFANLSTANETFTCANVAGFYAGSGVKGAASTVTNWHGVYIADQTQGTNNFGITSLVSAGTNKWNIYASGTAANYFAGNVGIGTTQPTRRLDVVENSSSVVSRFSSTNGTSAFVCFSNTTATADQVRIGSIGNDLVLSTNYTERLRITSTGTVRPGADNTQSLGEASFRWSTVFAGTGTINTSDAREKTAVSQFSDAELNAAKQLSKEIGVYQFLASVESKGDAARKHIGLTVQRAIEIMESNGLDPFSYGFICYDEWDTQTVEHPAIEAVEAQDAWTETIEHDAELDEEGNIVKEARSEVIEHPAVEGVEAKDAWTEVVVEAGNRYGFRYDQLNMFIARGIESRLAALEAA